MEIINNDKLELEDIYDAIETIRYFYDEPLTICILTLKNGFKVVGQSSCVDAKAYDKDTGEKISAQNAFEKIWELEGYRLKHKLFEEKEDTSE